MDLRNFGRAAENRTPAASAPSDLTPTQQTAFAVDIAVQAWLILRVMHRVIGIGGLFFRAKDPAELADWYRTNLGIDPAPADYSQKAWSQEAGPTIFAPFPEDSEYFGDAEKQWMLNFRVADLDAIVAQLRAAGIDVSVDPKTYPNGRFARLHDPEGNPIELWEPPKQGQN